MIGHLYARGVPATRCGQRLENGQTCNRPEPEHAAPEDLVWPPDDLEPDHPDLEQDAEHDSPGRSGADRDDTAEGDRRPTQSERLVRLALDGFDLIRCDAGDTYAVPKIGPRIATRFHGNDGLADMLAAQFYDQTGKVPNSAALAECRAVLDGKARRLDPTPVALRAARSDDGGTVTVDLGDQTGQAVTITGTGWQVSVDSPVLFRRTAQTHPMPTPVRPAARGTGLARMRRLVHLPEASWQLLVCWMAASFFPDVARPILALVGEQGTAKTSTARMIVDLVDPAAAATGSPPREDRDWRTAAKTRHVVCIDNVSTIPEWLSDTLCRAVTGDAYAARQMRSDDDVIVHRFRRAIIVTAIDVGPLRGDLAGRWLPVTLDVIAPASRREESELLREWTDTRPAALADLLDLVADVLRVLPAVALAERPRLADFARIAAAVDQVTGWATLPDFVARSEAAQADVVAGDPFATAVAALIDRVGSWTGTASELLDVVPRPDPAPRSWPATHQAVGGQLRRVAPALRAAGYHVDRLADSKGRPGRLTHLAKGDGTGKAGNDAGEAGKRGGGDVPAGQSLAGHPASDPRSGAEAGRSGEPPPPARRVTTSPASSPLQTEGSGERSRRSEPRTPLVPLPPLHSGVPSVGWGAYDHPDAP
jgi:hypothetical protein